MRGRTRSSFTISMPASLSAGGNLDCDLTRSRGSGSWWSQTESNRRHPACKAGALPTELWPLTHCVSCLKPRRAWSVRVRGSGWRVVGPTRFELVTSRLSSVRSNQLSYGPIGRIDQDPVTSLLRDQNPFLGSRSPHQPERLDEEWKEKRRRRRSAHCI